jgi:hypothetical protein
MNRTLSILSSVFGALAAHAATTTVLPAAEGPWAENPVVFSQELPGATSSAYATAWDRWKERGYHPAGLSAVDKPNAAVLYSGLWQINPRVVDWRSHRNLTDGEYEQKWQAYADAGFRVLDLDAHVVGNVPYFDAIWVKEQTPQLFYSHRRLTLGELDAKLVQYRQQGYRPTKINAYRVGSEVRYAAVWVKDGKLDFQAKRDLTDAQYHAFWTAFKNQGYHPVDIAAYVKGGQQRFAGIWLRDAAFENWSSLRAMTATSLAAEQLAKKEANYVMVDLDAYYTPGGALRFAAIWLRTQPRNVLRANVPLAGSAIDSLKAKLAEYVNPGADGRSGAFGFYIEDLTTGQWIAFNPHEHFYMASTSKVLIGSKLIAMPAPAMGTLYTLSPQNWRGEDDRGFDETDIGDQFPVSAYLANMIDNSDSASTDKLFGLTVSADGARAVNRFARDAAGMVNLGEVTTICNVDKGVQRNANLCVDAVPCHSFETWYRDGGNLVYATPVDAACFGALNASPLPTESRYDLYYHTLDNSVTPAEYGRFFRRLADHELLTAFDEAALVAELDKNNSFNSFSGDYYDAWGGKGGDKRKVKSWVGVAWNWDYASGDYSSLTHQFSVALFTESWSSADATAEAKASAIMDQTVKAVLPYLVGKR